MKKKPNKKYVVGYTNDDCIFDYTSCEIEKMTLRQAQHIIEDFDEPGAKKAIFKLVPVKIIKNPN